IGLCERDCKVIRKSNLRADMKPKKDTVMADGQKVTLGDVTVTLYVTPGNSPGTLSMIISPLKDGNQKHVGSHFAGRGFVVAQDGVQYFLTELDAMQLWTEQI